MASAIARATFLMSVVFAMATTVLAQVVLILTLVTMKETPSMMVLVSFVELYVIVMIL